MHHFLLRTTLLFLLVQPTLVRAEIRHAQNFEIEKYATHRIITVRNSSRNSERVFRYALVPKGQQPPKLPDDIQLVPTPVDRFIAMETVAIGYLDALKKLDVLVGAATADYVSNRQVVRALEKGRIEALQTGQSVDVEKILQLQPDLILTSTIGDPAFDLPSKLARTGLPVAVSASYMEQHPLARAEWIKFIAAFLEETERANKIFQQIESRYLELAAMTRNIEAQPTVLCGAPYSGVWHVPGGKSFTARAIQDAGGNYLWSEDASQGGLPLDIERVFLKGAHADFWINPSGYRSMSALLSADQRFNKFRPARRNKVYNNTRQVSPTGGNAIWESGIVRPDDVLADLIHIFHPGLLPDHDLVYYERLE